MVEGATIVAPERLTVDRCPIPNFMATIVAPKRFTADRYSIPDFMATMTYSIKPNKRRRRRRSVSDVREVKVMQCKKHLARKSFQGASTRPGPPML
jgi:hypothetical protein